MSDIKLFQITDNTVVAIEGQSVAVEKSLQTLIEKHLEAFLGIRFLASEHTTGKTHGGRIDTLGIDENATHNAVLAHMLVYKKWKGTGEKLNRLRWRRADQPSSCFISGSG